MEYRRRRRAKPGGDPAGNIFRALLLLAVFGAAAYLIFGTGLGARIKDTYADTLKGVLAEVREINDKADVFPLCANGTIPDALFEAVLGKE